MNNQIIFIGDSLTESGNWDKLFPNKNIINFGVGGNKTGDILNRLSKINDYNPSKIFLMMGINDLGENISISEIIENYWKVVSKITQQWNKIKLHLLSILPVDYSRWTNTGLKSANINKVNKLIKNIAQYYNVTYINMSQAFTDNFGNLNPKLTTDGLHLNIDGYNVWKKEIDNFI